MAVRDLPSSPCHISTSVVLEVKLSQTLCACGRALIYMQISDSAIQPALVYLMIISIV